MKKSLSVDDVFLQVVNVMDILTPLLQLRFSTAIDLLT